MINGTKVAPMWTFPLNKGSKIFVWVILILNIWHLQDSTGVYRPPKLAPAIMNEDKTSRQERNALRKEQEMLRQAKQSTYMKELIDDIEGRPEEVCDHLVHFCYLLLHISFLDSLVFLTISNHKMCSGERRLELRVENLNGTWLRWKNVHNKKRSNSLVLLSRNWRKRKWNI